MSMRMQLDVEALQKQVKELLERVAVLEKQVQAFGVKPAVAAPKGK